MDIGKFTASLASAVNENTITAAQINFDFSLLKFQAPPEYQPFGDALTQHRRTVAEEGSQHITARKLGALFKPVLPSTPALLKAYGKRVSEISANEKINPKGTEDDGGFAPHVGADGTSIWAAATSGQEAIAVHLLACMLARQFPGGEATSIWVQLVQERKRQIETEYNEIETDLYQLQLQNAARQEISRSQLANWDASARSWLLTADEAKISKHKQLQLILKNISVQVNTHKNLYESVMTAWTSAMTALENIIKGMPQRVQDGALLLGLSSWHIYPDLVLLLDQVTEVKFNDALVPTGGILTFGLQHSAVDNRGVSWSFSLAHLRFYGEAVVSSRSSDIDSSRITFKQLGVAVLGSIGAGWGFEETGDIEEIANWFVALWGYFSRYVAYSEEHIPKELTTLEERESFIDGRIKHLEAILLHESEESEGHEDRAALIKEHKAWTEDLQGCASRRNRLTKQRDAAALVKKFLECSSGWVESLARCSSSLLESKDMEQEHFRKLARYGQRQGRIFLAKKKSHPPPVFGLLRPSTHLQFLSGEQRVQFLRRIALESGLDQLPQGAVVIIYRRRDAPSFVAPENLYEFATAIPHSRAPPKGAQPGELAAKRHARFVGFPRCHCQGKCNEKLCACRVSGVDCTIKCHLNVTEQRKCKKFNDGLETTKGGYWHTDEDNLRSAAINRLGEDCFSISDTSYTVDKNEPDTLNWIYAPKDFSARGNSTQRGNVRFRLLCGNTEHAAIYIRDNEAEARFEQSAKARSWRLKLQELTQTLSNDSFDQISVRGLAKWITERGPPQYSVDLPTYPYYQSLMILMGVEKVYSQLANATVSLGVMSRPLHDVSWAPDRLDNYFNKKRDTLLPFPRYQGYELNRTQAFACIAMLDSGTASVNPSTLDRVMAMSSGNSIYVSMPLLTDPFNVYAPHKMKRIIGNIGRPGITMLISPENPRLRQSGPEHSWKMVNHDPFDGKKENCFGSTSMHLSFTGYEVPVSLNSQGLQDVEVYLLESVISVHERGKWIADLDILGMLEGSKHLKRHEVGPNCPHQSEQRRGHDRNVIKLAAIDNWDELLDNPLGAGVVRADGTWTARLGTTVAALQKGHPVCVIKGDACWECMRDCGIFGKQAKKGRLQPDKLPHIFIY